MYNSYRLESQYCDLKIGAFKMIIDDELCEIPTHPPYLYHLIIMVFAPKIDIRV